MEGNRNLQCEKARVLSAMTKAKRYDGFRRRSGDVGRAIGHEVEKGGERKADERGWWCQWS